MDPTYKQQVDFIAYLQRLLQEGDFSSTYKFAFLHALADICIEKEMADDAATQRIELDVIVYKLIDLYWRQAMPFDSTKYHQSRGGILLQNSGKQAKIIADIIALQDCGVKQFNYTKDAAAKEIEKLKDQVFSNTKQTLKQGPLWRLQILSKEEDCYLFPHVKNRDYIELRSGIAACFRKYYHLVTHFARQGWINKISKIRENQRVIGKVSELNDFLFGTSRQSLKSVSDLFEDIQKGNCFYCGKPLKSQSEVDHFIPFSRYNNDLAHNFVLAHKACNNNKRDYLAAPKHKENWLEQNIVVHNKQITDELSSSFTCDPEKSISVANWAYDIAEKNGSKFWLSCKNKFV